MVAPEPRAGPPPRIGPYEVVRELGRGGMGVVLQAHDPVSGRDVALKLSLVPLEGERARRFEREGLVAAALSHPGLVGVHAAGVADGRPYLAYALVEGARPLDEACRGAPLARRIGLVRDAARALGHAHRRGVVHRDIKPANILVDGDGQARVADFGLALLAGEERLTRTGHLLGTPAYMAPEQFAGRGAEVGPPADVWALGAVLYEVLTGEAPFQGDTIQALIGAILAGRVRRPRALTPGVSRRLEAVVLRALALDPARRHPDGEALARDLDAILAGRGPVAWSTPRPATVVGAAAALGVAALACAVLGLTRTPPPDVAARRASPAGGAEPTSAATTAPPRSGVHAGVAGVEAQRGEQAILAGRYEEALAHLDRALALDPTNALALVNRAFVHIHTGDPVRAERDADQALALDPTLATAWANRGAARFALERLPEAEADLSRALDSAPGSVPTRWDRALLRVRRGDVAGAVADLDALLAIDTYHAEALELRGGLRFQLDDVVGARADLDRALALGERPLALFRRGSVLARLGLDALALADLDRAEALGHDDPDLLKNRIVVLLGLGDLARAAADAARTVARAPGDATLRVQLGSIRMRLGDLPGTIAACAEALAIDPQVPRGHLYRGMALDRAGRHEEALADLDRAVALDPSDSAARVERGRVLANAGRLEDALVDLDQAVSLAPTDPVAWGTRGQARILAGDLPGALSDLDETVRLDARLGLWRACRARVHEALGHARDAEADLRAALELVDPSDASAAQLRSDLERLTRAR